MAEFLLELLFHFVLRTVLGLFVGIPTFCGALAYRVAHGVSLSGAVQSAAETAGRVFAGCFD
jgi:hypothetical protein